MKDSVSELTFIQGSLGLLLVLVLIGVLVAAILVARRHMRRAPAVNNDRSDDHIREKALKNQVYLKAAGSGVRTQESVRNLTDSGVIPVVEMIEALAGSGNYAEAEKWALNAIKTQPHRLEIPLKLAEVYYRAGRKNAFVAVASGLMRKQDRLPEAAQHGLMAMGRKLAPDELPFSAPPAPTEATHVAQFGTPI